MDVAQAFGQLEIWVVVQPPLESGDDLGLGRPGPRGPRTARMNGKPNLRVVAAFSRWMLRELLRRAVGQTGLALLVRRFGGQRLRTIALPASSGCARISAELRFAAGVATTCDQRELQLRERCGTAAAASALGDPRRVLVDAVEQPRRIRPAWRR